MVTMDLLEQDNYYDTTPITTPSFPYSVGEYNEDSLTSVTAGKCNWRHSGWSARLVGFPQCYLTCRFLTNKIFYLIQVWVAFQNEKEEG